MNDPWRYPVQWENSNNNNTSNKQNKNDNSNMGSGGVNWQSMLETARQIVPEDEAPRIHRSLYGIEKEAARLASKHARHVPASQIHSYAESKNVDIRSQTDFVNNLDESKIFAVKPSTIHEQMFARMDQQFVDTSIPDGGIGISGISGITGQQTQQQQQQQQQGVGLGVGASSSLMTPSRRRAQYMARTRQGTAVAAAGSGTVGGGTRRSAMLLTPSQFQAQYQSSLPSGMSPNDLKNLLKYHHEYVVSSTIQECHLLSARHFRKKLNESLEKEWDSTKDDILEYLGIQRTNGANTLAGGPTSVAASKIEYLLKNTPSKSKSLLNSLSTKKRRRRRKFGDASLPNDDDNDDNDDNNNNYGDDDDDNNMGANNNNNNSNHDNDNDNDDDDDYLLRDMNNDFMRNSFTNQWQYQSQSAKKRRKELRMRQEQQYREQKELMKNESLLEFNEWERKYANIVYEIADSRRIDAPMFDYTMEKENFSDNNNNNNRNNNNGSNIGNIGNIRNVEWKHKLLTPFNRFLEIQKQMETELEKQYHSLDIQEIRESRDRLLARRQMWEALCWMIDEPNMTDKTRSLSENDGGMMNIMREYEFYNSYVESMKRSNDGSKHIGLQRMLVDGAIRYLQHGFWLHMKHTVNEKKHICNLGGNPSQQSYIKAYLRSLMHDSPDTFFNGIEHTIKFAINNNGGSGHNNNNNNTSYLNSSRFNNSSFLNDSNNNNNNNSSSIFSNDNSFFGNSGRYDRSMNMNNGNYEEFPIYALIYYSFRIGNLQAAIDFAAQDKGTTVHIMCALENIRDQLFELQKKKTLLKSGGNGFAISTNNSMNDDDDDDNAANNNDDDNDNDDDEYPPTGQKMVDLYAMNKIRLNRKLWKNLDAHYKEKVKNQSNDTYEILMYVILGRFDTSKEEYDRIQSMFTTEDYLWLCLTMLIENKSKDLPDWISQNNITNDNNNNNNENNNDKQLCAMTLSQLQTEFFASTWHQFHETNPYWYGFYLLLTQQFERFVDFLFKNDFEKESIHFGICLRYYGLLQTTNDEPKSGMITNLESKIKMYCEKFLNYAKYLLMQSQQEQFGGNNNKRTNDIEMDIADCYKYFFVYLAILDEQFLINKKIIEYETAQYNAINNNNNNNNLNDINSMILNKNSFNREMDRVSLSLEFSPMMKFLIEKLSEPAVRDFKFLNALVGDTARFTGTRNNNNNNTNNTNNSFMNNFGLNNDNMNEINQRENEYVEDKQKYGLIFKFLGKERFQELLYQSALKANEIGNKALAIRFFIFSGRFNEACAVIINFLGSLVRENKHHSEKQRILKFARYLNDTNEWYFERKRNQLSRDRHEPQRQMMTFNRSSNNNDNDNVNDDDYGIILLSDENRFNLECIIKFSDFYNEYNDGKYKIALKIIESAGVIPLFSVFEEYGTMAATSQSNAQSPLRGNTSNDNTDNNNNNNSSWFPNLSWFSGGNNNNNSSNNNNLNATQREARRNTSLTYSDSRNTDEIATEICFKNRDYLNKYRNEVSKLENDIKKHISNIIVCVLTILTKEMITLKQKFMHFNNINIDNRLNSSNNNSNSSTILALAGSGLSSSMKNKYEYQELKRYSNMCKIIHHFYNLLTQANGIIVTTNVDSSQIMTFYTQSRLD